jgi:hypothetical protein
MIFFEKAGVIMKIILGLGLWCLTPTFNNISVISWRSILLVEETGEPGENHDLPQVTDKPEAPRSL